MPEQRLSDKVFVVTGSTMGIGEGIARRLASEGAAVVVSGRSVDLGRRVAREIREAGGRARFVRADVCAESDCVALIQVAMAWPTWKRGRGKRPWGAWRPWRISPRASLTLSLTRRATSPAVSSTSPVVYGSEGR